MKKLKKAMIFQISGSESSWHRSDINSMKIA